MSEFNKTIRCTESSAAQFRDLVKADPELSRIVQQLQAQNMFPGLRAMSITLRGSRELIEQGLKAWPAPTPNQPQQACAVDALQQDNGCAGEQAATQPGNRYSREGRLMGCAESPFSARVQAPRIGNRQAR